MKLRKVWSKNTASRFGGTSAVWEIQEAPGIWIRKAHTGSWKAYLAKKTTPELVELDQSLNAQRFATRKEASQAALAASTLTQGKVW